MDEIIFYERNNIKITNARFVINNQTYALSKVNSVKVNTVYVPSLNSFLAASIAGASMTLFGLIAFGCTNPFYYLFLVVIVFACAYLSTRIKNKFEYSLILTTSSGEQSVLKGYEKQSIVSVEKALNDAIVYRG